MTALYVRRLALFFLFASFTIASSSTDIHAQTQESDGATPPVTLFLRGDETTDDVSRGLRALEATGRSVSVQVGRRAGAPAVPQPGAPASHADNTQPSARTRLDVLWDTFVVGIEEGSTAIPRAVELPEDLSRAWQRNLNGTPTFSIWQRVLAIFAAAFLLGILIRGIARRALANRLRVHSSLFLDRLRVSLLELCCDATGIATGLWAARVLKVLWLPLSDLSSMATITCINAVTIGACYLAAGRFLLAPGYPERRLLQIPRAERHYGMLIAYAVIVPAAVTASMIAERVAAHHQAAAGLFIILGAAVTAFKLWWAVEARDDVKALILSNSERPGPVLDFFAIAAPWVYAAIFLVMWIIGAATSAEVDGGRWAKAAEWTQLIVVLVPVTAAGIAGFLASRRKHLAETAELTPVRQAFSRAVQATALGAVWAVGLYVIATLWADFIIETGAQQFTALAQALGGVALLVFAGSVALVFLRSFFDAYTPRQVVVRPGEEEAEEAQDVPSRVATILPLLRGVVMAAVVGILILLLLSQIGVDIGPLLAGFGILGLAISFGSQALVRDIVSGFFFMLEDAFRVGEYVDTGRLKGTVEKISLRSIRLRHQSGQIHTVPFGQIPSLTNSSRDWATLKFNIRLDHSADIEKARKTIKKVGLALLEDPEFGPSFIAPLKMQGIAEIADSAIIARLKFTAKPAIASTVQREALKRIYWALKEADVPFASNAVTVRGGEDRFASGAGAIQAGLLASAEPLSPR